MDTAASGTTPAPVIAGFAPLGENQRIEALDVVRGFALIGIFLMNIEWFSRPISTMGDGMPRGLTGLDWFASWFIAYFVQGKFWTIFSLLFGMGFAVMLVRAERAGREFKRVYLRRILALAVFGAAHFIFLWNGDILFSYAVGALLLLIVLYGKPKPILIVCALLVGVGFIPDFDASFPVAGGLAVAGLLALYLRGERRVKLGGQSWPVFSFILLSVGTLMSIAAAVFWLLPNGPIAPRLPLSIFGPLLFVSGWLSWKYCEPASKRSLRLALSLYLFATIAMTAGGVIQYLAPDPAAAAAASTTAGQSLVKPPDASVAKKEKPGKTAAQRAAEIEEERQKRLAENKANTAEELKVLSTGSYLETVEWRARQFLEKAAGDAVFGILLVSMFLLGTWFVRSGVMENTGAHLAFFRKLALYALPFGVGLGLLGSLFTMSHTPGDRHDGWGIARGLLMMGNLPACLGYVGLVVLMLHSKGLASRIRVLAPMGRMALTHYLTQSLICALYFYGFAFGHWGMPRSQQVLFVLVVCAAQVAFSHWWLARFRYGPMEWFWRGFTYRQVPPFRIDRAAGAVPSTTA